MKKIFTVVLIALGTFSLVWASQADSESRISRVLVSSADIRDAFKITANGLIMRTGPGAEYPQSECYGDKVAFSKGDVVLKENGRKNGYQKVRIIDADCDPGWVAVKYLKATKYKIPE